MEPGRAEVTFPAGPLGITFSWQEELRCFVIQSFPLIPGTDKPGPSAGAGEVEVGDALVALDAKDLKGAPFAEVVSLLKSREAGERRLTFQTRTAPPGTTTEAPPPPPPAAVALTAAPPNTSTTATAGRSGGKKAVAAAEEQQGEEQHHAAFSSTTTGARSGHDEAMAATGTSGNSQAQHTGRHDLSFSLGPTRHQQQHGHTTTTTHHITARPAAKVYSPLQVKIEECLRADRSLTALHVEVHNESYWYAMRHKLGPRRQMHHGIRMDKRKGMWEAYLYAQRVNADTGQLEVGKRSLGHFSSQTKAFKKCEDMIKVRDGNPAESNDGTRSPITADSILRTHFRVLVVSEWFIGKDRMERTAMVLHALLNGLHVPEVLPAGVSAFETADARGMRGFSCAVGSRVLALPIFRHLGAIGPALLMLECKTPGQWLPERFGPTDGEVYGRSRIQHTALADGKLVTEDVNAQRLKMLLFGTKKTARGRLVVQVPRSPKPVKSKLKPSDMLGVVVEQHDPHHQPPGAKQGGIFGHFYHDMDHKRRTHTMDEYHKNVTAIKQAQKSERSPPHRTTAMMGATTMAMGGTERPPPGSKAVPAQGGDTTAVLSATAPGGSSQAAGPMASTTPLSPAGRPAPATSPPHQGKAGKTHVNDEKSLLGAFKHDMVFETNAERAAKDLDVVARYQMANRSLKGIAKRLQRIYRTSALTLAARRVWRHEMAALTVQRYLRGYYARVYFKLYKAVVHVACVKIQSAYRGVLTRRFVGEKKRVEYAAQTAIARVYKGRLARRFAAWVRQYQHAALVIETLVRGFLCRCRFKKLRAEVMMGRLFHPSAVVIQRHYRGYRDRQWVKVFVSERLHDIVTVPCAICIQRHVRGLIGRRITAEKRRLRRAVCVIQGLVRGFLLRRAVRRIRHRILRHYMAIRMQRVARGFMERLVVKRRRERRYRVTVMAPSAIRIQAHVRGFLQRKAATQRKQQWFAALRIQSQWRAYSARQATLERWRQMREEMKRRAVVTIQCNLRGWLGRRRARQEKLDTEGRRLYAARIILRAILRHVYSRKFRKLKEKWEVEQSAELLVEIGEEKQNLRDDIEDIDVDIEMMRRYIKRYSRRISDLREFRKEAGLRLPQVETELDDLGIEDIEGGWGEALEAEWESLHNRMTMSGEETRQLRIQIRNCEDDIMKLRMERDDYEMDLDKFQMREVAEYELLGRMEIERAGRKAAEEFRRKVYRQKCRWKDSSTRRKVIARSLDYIPDMQQKIKGRRTINLMGSMSSEKHWDREDEEAFLLKMMVNRERRRRAKEINSRGYKNQALADTIDSVISTTLDVVKGATYMMRRPPNDMREDPRAVCQDCGKVFCLCKGSQCYNAVKKLDGSSSDESDGEGVR